jgi:hypothetical protein
MAALSKIESQRAASRYENSVGNMSEKVRKAFFGFEETESWLATRWWSSGRLGLSFLHVLGAGRPNVDWTAFCRTDAQDDEDFCLWHGQLCLPGS